MQKLGFIGVGIMGKSMAKNLLDAGYSLIAYDINKEALEEIVSYGAKMPLLVRKLLPSVM